MSKIIMRLMVVLVFTGWAGSSSAALLTPITLNGSDWLQPIDFVNYSWNDISTVCDATSGWCNGSLGGNDLTGWTWASVDDINVLLNYYIGIPALGPGPSEFGEILSEATDWLSPMLADGFLPSETTIGYISTNWIVGWLRTSYNSNPSSGAAYTGRMGTISLEQYEEIVIAAISERTELKAYTSSGSWFYRGDLSTIAVPITDTLALVGVGMCALGFTGRKRTLHA